MNLKVLHIFSDDFESDEVSPAPFGFPGSASPMNARRRTGYLDDRANVDDPDAPAILAKPETQCSRCRRQCGFTTLWICYVLLQLVFILVFFLTVFHPFKMLSDMNRYRNDGDMYTVTLKNHRPQAMFLRCYGNGSETIVFENDIRTTALMFFDGLPKHLADQYSYKVCTVLQGREPIPRKALTYKKSFLHLPPLFFHHCQQQCHEMVVLHSATKKGTSARSTSVLSVSVKSRLTTDHVSQRSQMAVIHVSCSKLFVCSHS